MRTTEQIEKIKNRVIDPYVVKDFLTYSEIENLVRVFDDNNEQKIHKNTGPVTLNIHPFLHYPIFQTVLKKIENEIGKFRLMTAFFFTVKNPHIIHNDDLFELPDDSYRAITIPLTLNGRVTSVKYPRLCMFDQFYFHGPAKFFNKSENLSTWYNKQVYEYSQVDGLVDTPVVDENKYLTHLKPEWLEGLSLHSTLEWKPTNALIFDSLRLHCASDFRQIGIQEKLGLSIFTLKEH